MQNEDVFKVELDWMSFKVDLDWMFFFVLKNGHTQCPPSHTLQEQGCKHWLIQAQRERWHELYSEPRRNFFTSEVPLVLKYLNNTEWVAHRTEDVVRAYSREVPFMLTLAWAQYLYTNSSVGGTIYNTHTLKPFKELGLDSQRVKKLASKLHVHSVNFAAKLVHTRRALSSTIINSHQEPVSGQACNPPDPHWFFLSSSRWRSFTVLSTKVAPFP